MDKWRREMMKAIRSAAEPDVLFRGSSLTDGLRCIRTFERVNARAFNPFDTYHRDIVRGMGSHEALFRRMRRLASVDTHPKGGDADSVHG